MDILYLIDRLDNLIASSRHVPLTNQVVIKEADIQNLIEQMRTSIPEEVRQARRVIQEKERILAQAQADASSLLNRAREETERVINREGLLKAAEQRSQDLLDQAEQKAEQLKKEADLYALDTLRELLERLTQVETRVSRTALSVERGIESLEEATTMAEAKAPSYEDSDPESYITPEEEAYAQQLDEGPPPSENASLQTRPRRSLLAADTIGINQP
ncbi:hypothetical protein [Ktedonospora formicarum]|uniref:Vacuolar-type H+-ATPase subunit H n=1 Tax=Ktedonospora formicarum TaxID=2778364 RepID=A0A8J3I1Y0_9CHLR|nr:hypothetical protein [Ktedonospora formicarum]GHO43419.1 vacuolar-type H+-ATPase subunit H [Ktedonospora formicarum]